MKVETDIIPSITECQIVSESVCWYWDQRENAQITDNGQSCKLAKILLQ